jgi:hypothetical protein
MAKTFCIVASSQPILEAMWKELKAIGYTTPNNLYSLNKDVWNALAICVDENFPERVAQKDKFKLLVAIDGSTSKDVFFRLPGDYIKALAFAKEQMESFDKVVIPEYVECIIDERAAHSNFGELGKIYKVRNWNFSTTDCMLEGTTSGSTAKKRFKPSSKELFDLQNKPRDYQKGDYLYMLENYGGIIKKGEIYPFMEYQTPSHYCVTVEHDGEKSFLAPFVHNTRLATKEEIASLKPKFKVGDWIHLTWNDGKTDIFQIVDIKEGIFNTRMHYRNNKWLGCGEPGVLALDSNRQTLKLATKEQIEKTLIAEAKRRFPVGSRVKLMGANMGGLKYGNEVRFTEYSIYDSGKPNMRLFVDSNLLIYDGSVWAEIIQKPYYSIW